MGNKKRVEKKRLIYTRKWNGIYIKYIRKRNKRTKRVDKRRKRRN